MKVRLYLDLVAASDSPERASPAAQQSAPGAAKFNFEKVQVRATRADPHLVICTTMNVTFDERVQDAAGDRRGR